MITVYFADFKINDGPKVDPNVGVNGKYMELMLRRSPESKKWNLKDGARVDVDANGYAICTLADGQRHSLAFCLNGRFMFKYQGIVFYLYAKGGKFWLKVNARAPWCESLSDISDNGRYIARWQWFSKIAGE